MRHRTAMGIPLMAWVAVRANAAQQTETNVVAEVVCAAGRFHAEPFKTVTLDVVFTDPKGTQRPCRASGPAGTTERLSQSGTRACHCESGSRFAAGR